MLELTRLNNETTNYVAWGRWGWLPALLAALALLLGASLIFSLSWPMAQPVPDRPEHESVQIALQSLPELLDKERSLDEDWSKILSSQLSLLTAYRDAQSLKSDINPARDPLTFRGRINLVVDQLQILTKAPTVWANQKKWMQEMLSMKSALDSKRYPDGSSAKGFVWASMGWMYEQKLRTLDGHINWKGMEETRPHWLSMMDQFSALVNDLQSDQEGERKSAAKDLLQFLSLQGRVDFIKQTESLYAQVMQAKMGLSVSLSNFPDPEPPAIKPDQWRKWLTFPGTLEQGLVLLSALLGLLWLALMTQYVSHRKGMRRIAQGWLAWSTRQNMQIKKASPHLYQIQAVLSKSTDGLSELADQMLKADQENPPAQEDGIAALAWLGVHQLKTDIQQYVVQTREKLLNIHTQFCSGASRENLIYDIAFIAQALESIEESVSALNRQLDLLSSHVQIDDKLASDDFSKRWGSQARELRVQLRSMKKDLDALHGLIDEVVEDVPAAKRFESMPRYDSAGRRIDVSQ